MGSLHKAGAARDKLLSLIRDGREMTLRQQLKLTVILSMPAIVSQLSTIIMEYIDAAMVGSLGANASASIGLMATSTWLFWGLCSVAATGFSVQVANRIGARDREGAQAALKQSILPTLIFSLILGSIGVAISWRLPYWLGATAEIAGPASLYFLIFMSALPVIMMSFLSGAMLRCSGNTLFPGMVNVGMCVLDVLFNFFLIFPTRQISPFGITFTMPGAGLGVAGAALGTGLSEFCGGAVMLIYICFYNKELNLRGCLAPFRTPIATLARALRISSPLFAERVLLTGAQIITTAIVAPLGAVAIAANAFAVTAESLCYMPGYGISEAATTLVGQSLGASRRALARRFANITVISGITVMTIMGAVMYLAAPLMMGIITPVQEICDAGVEVLRIEAFAEPMFAASIVTYGCFIGAGDTFIPACMNLGSIWFVRLGLALLLAPTLGLKGVWIAMAAELCFRGIIFLCRLRTDYWLRANKKVFESE